MHVSSFLSRFFILSLALDSAALAATPPNSAVKPEQRMSLQPDPNWMRRHEGFLQIARQGGVNVLFLGDSITDAWRRDGNMGGKKVWDEHFAPLGAANFGIGGDRTQHVLWRIQNGELEGLRPKVVVLLIGTNNTGFEADGVTRRNQPADVIAGVAAVVEALRARAPESKILLLAIFPRGEHPDHPQRQQINQINPELAKLADGKTVQYLDIGDKFLAPDGTIPKEIMPDFLHLSAKGYEIWADAIKAPLAQLMQ